MWIPPEIQDPILWHASTRKSVGYFGAVCLRDGRLVTRRETSKFNSASFLAFLQQLREASRNGGREVVVICDNASYHHAKAHLAWRQQQESEFLLEFLPPYSPDLNPIERVWKLTRRNCLHNRYFPGLADIIGAAESEFLKWMNPNEVLRRLCAII
jgi:transposase